MPDIFTQAKRSAVMAAIRGSGNKDTELRMMALLRAAGITGWRRQMQLRIADSGRRNRAERIEDSAGAKAGGTKSLPKAARRGAAAAASKVTGSRQEARGKSGSPRPPGADSFHGMNWHEVIDERSLELHGVIARELKADPAKIDLVVAWIQRFLDDPDYSERGKDALSEWLEIIREGLPRVLEVLADRSDEGQRMRHSTPFAVIMPQDERARILAKYEARSARAHSAGV